MGLERLFRGLYGARPQIDIEEQIARVRVPEPVRLDFVEIEEGIRRNNLDVAAIVLHADVVVSGKEVRLENGQRFPLRGDAEGKTRGRRRMSVHDWKTPEKTSIQILE